MEFVGKLLRGITLLPGVVQGTEGTFGAKTGEQKRAAALEIVGAAIKIADAAGSKEIADADGFAAGLGKIIDGMVECLNASVWAKR
jgi:hypothetical protein